MAYRYMSNEKHIKHVFSTYTCIVKRQSFVRGVLVVKVLHLPHHLVDNNNDYGRNKNKFNINNNNIFNHNNNIIIMEYFNCNIM